MNTIMQFGEFVDFAPVDSSSAVWAVGDAGDIGTVVRDVKQGLVSEPDGCREGLRSWPASVASADPGSMLLPRTSFNEALHVVNVREDTLQCAVARLGGGAQDYWNLESPDENVTASITRGIEDLGVPPAAKRLCGMSTNHCDARGPCFHAPMTQTSPLDTCETVNHGAAYTRALRKSHMVRQRGQTRVQRPQSIQSKPGHQSRRHHDVTEPKLCNENGKGYEFLFQKELRASDVSSLGRIVLPKRDAERHLPNLIVGEGIMISLEDYHCGKLWTARFRFWPNNNSRMYLLEHVGDFVNFHHLQVGDLFICYRNEQGGYVIRGQKVGNPGKELNSKARENSPTTEMKTASHQFVGGENNATSSFENGTVGEPFPFQDGVYRRQQDGVPASYCNPLEQDWGNDPVVAMLSGCNVRHRFMDEDQILEE